MLNIVALLMTLSHILSLSFYLFLPRSFILFRSSEGAVGGNVELVKERGSVNNLGTVIKGTGAVQKAGQAALKIIRSRWKECWCASGFPQDGR